MLAREGAHLLAKHGHSDAVTPCSEMEANLRVGLTMPPCKNKRRPFGVLLLEVLVALTIMIGVLGVLSGQLMSGLKMVALGEERTRASQLADRILALLELDPDTAQRILADLDTDGEFGEELPGWFWRVTVEPTDVSGLGHVTIEILHQSDLTKKGDIESARVVRSLHVLKAEPACVDLVRDFGIDEEQAEMLAGTLPIPGVDVHCLDPHAIVALPPEQLLTLMPMLAPFLTQFMGGGSGGIPGIGDLAGLLGGGGGDLSGLLGGGAGGDLGGLLAGGGAGGLGALLGNPDMINQLRNMPPDMLKALIKQFLGDRISDEELDKAFENFANGGLGNLAGGLGEGGLGPGRDGFPQPGSQGPQRGGMSRDQIREIIKSSLGDQITEEELEQALDQMDKNQGNQDGGDNRGGGNNIIRPGGQGGQFGPRSGGNLSGGNRTGGGRGGQTIRDFNNRRDGQNGGRGGGDRGGNRGGGKGG